MVWQLSWVLANLIQTPRPYSPGICMSKCLSYISVPPWARLPPPVAVTHCYNEVGFSLLRKGNNTGLGGSQDLREAPYLPLNWLCGPEQVI